MYNNCGQLHLEENGLFDFDLHVMIANVYWKPDPIAFEKFNKRNETERVFVMEVVNLFKLRIQKYCITLVEVVRPSNTQVFEW